MPPIPEDIERLVIVCPSWVGDTVMATPVLRAARQTRPNARITAACRPGLDDLLAGAPWLDETVTAPTKKTRGMLEMARALRRRRPQAVLLLPNSFRSGLLGRLCGASRRIGYRRDGRGPLLTHWIDPPRDAGPVPARDYYRRLAEFALGLQDIDTRLELGVTEQERAEAARLLEGITRPFALLCPGANKPPKRWPAERFAAVADALAQRHGLAVAATGSPAEQPIIRAVAEAAAQPVHDLAQRGITIGGLKAVTGEARLVITNDTGPRHVAAARGTPVVTLFGPTDPRWTTIDNDRERMLVAEPFLPRELTADDDPARCLITRITVGDVLSATERLLAASGGKADAGHDASPAPTSPGRGCR